MNPDENARVHSSARCFKRNQDASAKKNFVQDAKRSRIWPGKGRSQKVHDIQLGFHDGSAHPARVQKRILPARRRSHWNGLFDCAYPSYRRKHKMVGPKAPKLEHGSHTSSGDKDSHKGKSAQMLNTKLFTGPKRARPRPNSQFS